MWLICLAACLLARPWRRLGWQSILLLLVPAIVIVFPWQVFQNHYSVPGQEAELALFAIGRILQGEIRWDAFYRIARYFGGQVLRLEAWGIFFPIATFALGVDFLSDWRALCDPGRLIPLLGAGLLGLGVVMMYFLTAYGGDLYFWLSTGFNRMLMPAVVLACVIGTLSLDRMTKKRKSPTGKL